MNNCFFETYRNPNRPAFWFIWMGWMVYAFLMILEGLVRLITLNIWMPDWTFDFVYWHSKKSIQWQRKCKSLNTNGNTSKGNGTDYLDVVIDAKNR